MSPLSRAQLRALDHCSEFDSVAVGQLIKTINPSRYMDIKLLLMDGIDEIQDMVARMDVDKDGAVSFGEFLSWWRSGGHLSSFEKQKQQKQCQSELRQRSRSADKRLDCSGGQAPVTAASAGVEAAAVWRTEGEDSWTLEQTVELHYPVAADIWGAEPMVGDGDPSTLAGRVRLHVAWRAT